jgi:hypothetical protein
MAAADSSYLLQNIFPNSESSQCFNFIYIYMPFQQTFSKSIEAIALSNALVTPSILFVIYKAEKYH